MASVMGVPKAVRFAAIRVAPIAAPAALVLAVQLVAFPVPLGVFIRGVIVGLLTALIAIGMALVHRANRILNFAQADLGFVPASLATMLIVVSGLPYLLAMGIGLAGALVLGAVVELVVIRRFSRAPRLILTVATLGLAQLLAALALVTPRVFGVRPASQRIPAPFHFTWTVGSFVLSANDLIAAIAAPLVMLAVGLFLRRTLLGVAVRASAERIDRAALLGIPVARLQTVVWALAGVLAYVAMFLRAGILGLPVGSALSLSVLLRALAALMLGRMTNLPAIALSATALGVLELGVDWNASSPLLIDPIVAGVILVALLLQRRRVLRSDSEEGSSWQAAEEVRPVPAVLARLPEVRVVRWGGLIALVAAAAWVPTLLSVDRQYKAIGVVVFALIGVSIVVLTGWAGQVSLGQMGFVGIGAAIGGKLTSTWHVDLLLALVAAGAVSALVAVVVGLPALRLRGLYLAVTTLGFSLTVSSWLLNRRFFTWVPTGRLERPPLFGRIHLESTMAMYELSLVVLIAVLVMVRGVRRSRTGRVVIALRENERAAQAFSVNTVRAKLTAFALSGAIAGVAGCLFVHYAQAFDLSSYNPGEGFAVFVTAVIGGLGSFGGAVIGALYLRGSQWFLPDRWQFLASGAGVLLALLILPGGLGGLVGRLRDRWLRSVARHHDLVVPALLGDGGAPADAEPAVVAS